MPSITQDMRYRESLLKYACKHGVSRACRKYNKSSSYVYFWKARYEENEKNIAEFKEKYQFIKKEHLNVAAKYKEMTDRYAVRLSEVEEAIENICNSI